MQKPNLRQIPLRVMLSIGSIGTGIFTYMKGEKWPRFHQGKWRLVHIPIPWILLGCPRKLVVQRLGSVGYNTKLQYSWVHPRKLTCPLKRDYFNRKCIFQPSFFRGYVSFQGGRWNNRFTNHLLTCWDVHTYGLPDTPPLPIELPCCKPWNGVASASHLEWVESRLEFGNSK